MKAIQQTSFALLSLSLLLLILVGAGFAFDKYTSRAPIYIPPPEVKDFSYVKSMRNATSLEGLKKICVFWAEREDQSQQYVRALGNRFTSIMHDLAIAMVVLGTIFSIGLLHIYLMARRLGRTQANAL